MPIVLHLLFFLQVENAQKMQLYLIYKTVTIKKEETLSDFLYGRIDIRNYERLFSGFQYYH
jgi:hypothetical protein